MMLKIFNKKQINKIIKSRDNLKIPKRLNFGKINSPFNFSKRSSGNKIALLVIFIFVIYIIGGFVSQYILFNNPNPSRLNLTLLNIYPFPVATVGTKIVPMENLLKQVSFVKQFSQQTGQDIGDEKTITSTTLDQLIETYLVLDQLNKSNVSVPSKSIDESLEKIVDENGGQLEVEKVLKSLYGMDLNDFRVLIKNQLAKDILNQEVLERVHLSHILFSDENQAKEVAKAIIERNDPKFADAARIFSKDVNTRDNGGDLGFIMHGTMPKDLEAIAFTKAKIGETYPSPIKTEYGWHIIKVEEKSGKINLSYSDWLENSKKNTLIKKFID